MLASNQQLAPALPPAMITPASQASRSTVSRPWPRQMASMFSVLPPATRTTSWASTNARRSSTVRANSPDRSARTSGRGRSGRTSPRRDRCHRWPWARRAPWVWPCRPVRTGTGRSGRRGPLPSAHRDDVALGHDSSMGTRTPRSCATSIARSYPASTCRTTPMPGSDRSTRASRSPAFAVPSATTTMPAWIEYPIPTPPP